MKKTISCLILMAGFCVTALLSGCIVVPDHGRGYYDTRGYHGYGWYDDGDRYHDDGYDRWRDR